MQSCSSSRRLPLLLLLLSITTAPPSARAAGPSTAPTTRAALQEISLRFAGVDRRYLLHVPANLDRARPAPLVMMLHGAGGSAEVAARAYGWCELADREGFIAVFPEAMRADMTRAGRAPGNRRLWNDASGRGFVGRRGVDDVGYLAAVLDDVARRCNVDADRVYCTGFSNGASMTFTVGVELSDRFAAIAPVSGHLWLADPKPKSPRPMFFLTGDADPLNPLAGGEAPSPWGGPPQRKPPIQKSIDAWVKLLDLDPTAAPKVLRDDERVRAVRYAEDGADDTGAEVVFYTIKGLGHEWPGRPRVLPRRLTGESNKAVDATALAWEFFKKHPRQAR